MRGRVLVLNSDYSPLTICGWYKAFLLLFLEKAELVECYSDQMLRSVTKEFPYPSVIRLLSYVSVPNRRVPLSRANIYKRDGFHCVYCGSSRHLTVDHVIPKSQGGEDVWENLVTACQRCNIKKGNRTPEQAGMQLRKKPYRPTYIDFLLHNDTIEESWRPYLFVLQ